LIQIPHDDIAGGVVTALSELKNEDYDGIFCVNNNIAKALLRELANKGDKLSNVQIISFDDIEIFDIVQPRISAIAQPIQEMGKTAVKLLLERLEKGENHIPKSVVLETFLVKR
jgi:DNA-binding LacI/PurR family transcriptional regulator